MTMQQTRCEECNYRAITHGQEECFKCGGKLEILASENKKEVLKDDRT